MSAKAGDDDDDNEVYVEDEYLEDDDDDEEDDFHPGGDDDDDDDEEYDDEEDDNDGDREVSYLDGALSYDVEGQKIHYKGHGFHLESTDAVAFNILDKACKQPPDNTLHATMMGPCDVVTAESSGRKPTPRKIQVTFMVADPNGEGIGYRNLKDGDDDNDEDEKKPSVYYQVYGSEIDNPEHGIDFTGSFAPISGGGTNEIRLVCQVRTPNLNAEPASTTAAVTNIDTTTTAAAVGKRRNYENDDNIDDEDDDGIDHNELIALHEEAQLSTEALKKRYRGPSIDNTNDDRDNAEQQSNSNATRISSTKKVKTDDDDDDDIEF